MARITIKNFKDRMMAKAVERGGIYENFGQDEIRELKDRYGYNPYGTEKERKIANQIDYLDIWCATFCPTIK